MTASNAEPDGPAGNSPNNIATKENAPITEGDKGDKTTEQLDFTTLRIPSKAHAPILSAVTAVAFSKSELTQFARLARDFAFAGLNLYPLDGDEVIVVSPTLGMSRVLPDLRAAQVYLRHIRGVSR